MTEPDSRVKVAILAVPEVTASTLFGMFDLFSSPGRDFSFITKGEAGPQAHAPVCRHVRRTRVSGRERGLGAPGLLSH